MYKKYGDKTSLTMLLRENNNDNNDDCINKNIKKYN
jgi:hypothetical protein